MKKVLFVFLLGFLSVLFLKAQLSGVKTIGTGGDYTTLYDAVDDVNNNGLNGNAVFEIMNGYENSEYIHIESYPGNEQYTLTIRPEDDAAEVIIKNSGAFVFYLDSTNNVIIDGRPGGKKNTCVLKIEHSNQNNSSAVEAYKAKHTTIRYCLIRHDGTRGVSVSESDSSLVENCDIATNTTGPISNTSTMGINICRSTNTVIRNNRIHDLHVEAVNAIYGICMLLIDISLSVDSVYNNFIALNTETIDSTAAIRGIDLSDKESGQLHVYHNTVYIGGDSIKDRYSYALFYDCYGTGTIMNNVFINKRSNGSGDGIHYGLHLYKEATATIISDYNAIVSNGIGGIAGFYEGHLDTTLSLWQGHTGWDMNSVSKEIVFREIETGDLHLAGSSLRDTELIGIFISGINDIDDEERWADSTFMGADQPVPCIPGTADPDNILENGNFEACTLLPWSLYYSDHLGATANMYLDNGTCVVSGITLSTSPEYWDVQLKQELQTSQTERLKVDSAYILSFEASAEAEDRPCRISFEQTVDPWANIMERYAMISTETETYSYEFVLGTVYPDMQLSLQLGTDATPVTFDNVKLVKKVGGIPTAIHHAKRNELHLFPNPASDYLFIHAETGTTIRLHNSTGMLVKTGISVNSRVNFDVTGLPAGLYFVTAELNDHVSLIKITIQ